MIPMVGEGERPVEPSEADRTLVAREIERLTTAAGPPPPNSYARATPEHVFYMGWVEILEVIGVTDAAAQLRADALDALKGARPVRVMEPAPNRTGWLAAVDDDLRHRSAVRRINVARRRFGLPKLREPRVDFDEETARHLTAREHIDWDYR